MNAPADRPIALSLVSHTNVGKTTLARTLLQRDIGEVRDEAHVTMDAERHTLIETPQGDRLELWDTPGFGNSERLAARLARNANPIGWFLNEVWDRWRDRALWSSQAAVRNVLEEADAVLYLVNASEAPQDAGYVAPELKVLDLLDKPTIVLLNQIGKPRTPAEEAAEVERWWAHCADHSSVRAVLALDAFARCWVQEGTLLDALADVLPSTRREAFGRLATAWRAQHRTVWRASMDVLGTRLARAAFDREAVRDEGWSGKLKQVGASIGLRREGALTPRDLAMQALAERLDADIRASTDQLIKLHGLDGEATQTVLLRLAENFAVREPLSEGKAAVLGGLVTGALAGLKADIATGGLTLGGGLLAGGVIGALSAAGLARGFNLVRGVDKPTLAWSSEVLDGLVHSALLGYLAVAHFGRGRGNWTASEHPEFWPEQVSAALAPRRKALQALWGRRADADELAEVQAELQALLRAASIDLFVRLYPDSKDMLRATDG
ncbi:MAG: GTPase domain-containing protein [Rhizobacter sp.]|nr:GTPase domain-containing protein [Rhizobacter sp.]